MLGSCSLVICACSSRKAFTLDESRLRASTGSRHCWESSLKRKLGLIKDTYINFDLTIGELAAAQRAVILITAQNLSL